MKIKFLKTLKSFLLLTLLSSCHNEEIDHLKSEIFDLKNEIRQLEQLKYDVENIRKGRTKTEKARRESKRAKENRIESNYAIQKKEFEYSANEKDDPFLGNKYNKNIMMIFSNFQSKQSAKFFLKNLNTIKRDYINNNKFKLVIRDFPLNIYTESVNASKFANCAGEQARYWDAFKELYLNQDLIKDAQYSEIAEKIGDLNLDSLNTCINNPRQREEIDLDKSDAQKIEIKGIPNIFIGKLTNNKYSGYLIRGAQPFNIIKQYLDEIIVSEKINE